MLGIYIKIDLKSHRLRLRKTLPPRPGSGRAKWYQQAVTLGLNADSDGVKQAMLDVIELNRLLSERRFDWKIWDKYLVRSCKNRVRQTELIGAQVDKFQKYFLALPEQKVSRENAWKYQYYPQLKKLPSDQYLTDQILLEVIEKKTKQALVANSSARSPLYSSGDKMVVKDNCPVFNAWIVVNEQAVPT